MAVFFTFQEAVRPESLNFLFSSLGNLNGVGEKTLKSYQKLLCKKRTLTKQTLSMFDLLYHFPERILHRKIVNNVREIPIGDFITAKVKVLTHEKGNNQKSPYRIVCQLGESFISIVYYKVYENYVKQKFKVGTEVLVSGKTEKYNDEVQLIQPDYIINGSNGKIAEFENIYPLTFGITNKEIVSNIDYILGNLQDLQEWLPQDILEKNNFLSWKDSLINLHKPTKLMDAKDNLFLKRLAFDEMLARQLSLRIVKNNSKSNSEKNLLENSEKKLIDKFLRGKIAFELTNDQKKVLEEIEKDTFSKEPMMRLLQGDVGSGKTIVAFLSALNYIENKKQVAFMVPTSILAMQHYENISKLCEGENIRVELLIGQTKTSKKKKIIEELESGEIDMIIGTHTLIEENIQFKSLSYVVIDEQQRFGVEQRLNLIKKNKNIDILSMTATPIPRTLALTLYNDMDLSVIKEKPINRKNVITSKIEMNKYNDLLERIRTKFSTDEKIFWICPLVEETEKSDLMNIKKRYEEFCNFFGKEKVSFIHGKLKEKDEIMEDFLKNEKKKILIATTVIEIGIDIKDATIIVIEHPERFGLSQLHQLRGRVGRGDRQSYCVLLYENKNIGARSIKRLSVMCRTNDGFEIAEEDLKIRGIGEILGLKQSGNEDFIAVDLDKDYDIFVEASKLAKEIVDRKEEKKYLTLLYLFNYIGYMSKEILN